MPDPVTPPNPATPGDKPGNVPDPSLLTIDSLRREVSGLESLFNSRLTGAYDVSVEKFRNVDNQFALVERQRVEQKADTKTAVDAALQAQKEAVREQTTASEAAIAKSEAATSKQLEQLQLTFNTAISGVTSSLADLKERILTIEATGIGRSSHQTDSRAGMASVLGVVAGVIGVVSLIVTLVVVFGQ